MNCSAALHRTQSPKPTVFHCFARKQTTNEALNQEKQRMDVLLARQYNLISCVLQQEDEGGVKANRHSIEHRTLGECCLRGCSVDCLCC